MTFFSRGSLLLIFSIFCGCAVEAPLPENYYSGTDKIAGGKPPTTPVVTFDATTRRLDFGPAIDPETGAEVARYFIYFYFGTPTVYYVSRDIIKTFRTPEPRTYTIPPLVAGSYTFVVTGYDGYRESAVTDASRIALNEP